MIRKIILFVIVWIAIYSPSIAQNFQKTYGAEGDEVGTSIVKVLDGFLVSGYIDRQLDGNWDLLMLKINTQGQQVWSKSYGLGGKDFARCTIGTFDGNFVTIGESNSDILVMQTNPTGDVIWMRLIGGFNEERGFSVIQDIDGSLYVVGDTQSYGEGYFDLLLIKMTQNGDIEWAKTYGNNLYEAGFDIVQTQDDAFIIACTENTTSNGFAAMAVKVDKTGNIVWSRTIDGNQADNFVTLSPTSDNGVILYGHTNSCSSSYNNTAIALDENGQTKWIRSFGVDSDDRGFTITPHAPNHFLLVNPFRNSTVNGKSDIEVLEIDEDGTLLRNIVYGSEEDDYQYWAPTNGIISLGTEGFALPIWTESFGQGAKDIEIIKDNFDSNFECNTKTAGIFENNCSLTNNPVNLIVNDIAIPNSTPTLSISDVTLISGEICCEPLNPVISGNLTYCEEESTTLEVGNFEEYLWSNGATTQQIEATEGVYTIRVTDENGCTGIDEITVESIPNLSPQIEGKLTHCEGESTTLEVGNFEEYLWSNGETNQQIEVTEGVYTITVTDENGCTGINQVTVESIPNLSPQIEGELTHCEGESTTLEIGNFEEYLWSNGETNQQIEVTEGVYTITVTDENGCIGIDQVTVKSISNFSPQIEGELTYCEGESTTLEVGNFEEYLWSNGETNQQIEVTEGVYTITVTNENSCTGIDQVTIESISNFSPQIEGELTYCVGESTTLEVENFEEYLWSNGATTQQIEVTEGIYTITVTDENGCTDIDEATVIIRDCSLDCSFMIPNSFSPNEDGINDFIGVETNCDFSYYQFSIYNRYGEKVFETEDASILWNGSFKQKKQDIGTYAWHCQYRISSFVNQSNQLETKSGNLTLIR